MYGCLKSTNVTENMLEEKLFQSVIKDLCLYNFEKKKKEV